MPTSDLLLHNITDIHNQSTRLPILSFIWPSVFSCCLLLALAAYYSRKRLVNKNPVQRLRNSSIVEVIKGMGKQPSAATNEHEFVVTRRRLETFDVDFSGRKKDEKTDNYATLDNESDAQSVKSESSITNTDSASMSSDAFGKSTSSTRHPDKPPLETVWSGVDPYSLKSQESFDSEADAAAFDTEMDLIKRLSSARAAPPA
jgi:hypothetical protein